MTERAEVVESVWAEAQRWRERSSIAARKNRFIVIDVLKVGI